MKPKLLSKLACLFDYPTEKYFSQASECMELIREQQPDAVEVFEPFLDYVRGMSISGLEESFSYMFDLSPVCTLEIGWHLFGEDYRRGQYMAKMRRELVIAGIEETHELPDHLTHSLLLLDAMSPQDSEYFASACVIPGMEKMVEGFEKQESAYKNLVDCAFLLIKSHQEQNSRQLTNE